ncbi:MAG: hypothetical protein QOI09_348 [Chloroflexota bacterium]|jgi:hypothetical protein|nr:hypothetical protein [Chloroflexota bacterium]
MQGYVRRSVGPLRRFLTLVAAAAIVVALVGQGALQAASPKHTQQSIAAHILKTKAGQLMTAPARAVLERMARGERPGGPAQGNAFGKLKVSTGGVHAPTGNLTNVRINDPAADSHQVDQTTQSETAIAVAGSNVVVGWNDSQQSLQPFLTAGSNLNGYGYSGNGGATWADGGTIPNAPGMMNLGDPWLASDRAGNFYYSSLAIDGFSGNLDVSVAKSTNSGHTFSAPINASPSNAFFYFGDKDAMTVGPDPATKTRDNVYVAWDDFACDDVACFNGLPVAHSTDGGATWQIVYADKFTFDDTAGCSFTQYIGAQPLVDPGSGTLYVAAERFAVVDPLCDGSGTSTIDESIFKSTDGGKTFGSRVTIGAVTPAFPNGFMLLGPGQVVRTIEFPTLALFKGNLYAAWNDGASGNSHIRLARSTNGGASWSLSSATNGSNDEIQPALSSDASALHLLFYQRNSDNTIDVIAANSTNGNAFVQRTATSTSFPGVTTAPQFDPLIAGGYMGDYIANVADATHQYFAWGDNRDKVTNFLWPAGRNDPNIYFARQ